MHRAFAPRIRDRLETYVMVWIGEQPRCLLPSSGRVARNIKVGVKTNVWLRAVSRDALSRPVDPISVTLEAVDPWGDAIPDAHIEPATITTNALGFNSVPIALHVDRAVGGFYVRARYPDRHTTASTLSVPIIVEFRVVH